MALNKFYSVILIIAAALSGNSSAKTNVILMISDGQGFNALAAANMYSGTTSKGIYNMGEIAFDVNMAMQTYSAGNDSGRAGHPYDPSQMWNDFKWALRGATDSAAAATAMYTGTKTYDHRLSVSTTGQPLTTIFEMAAAMGMATGVVSSVNFTNATPAAAAAHIENRNDYADICSQMLDSKLDIIMGPGHPYYDNNGQYRALPNYSSVGNSDNWKKITSAYNGFKLIDSNSQFEALAKGKPANTKYIGVARVHSTLQQARSGDVQTVDRKNRNASVPTLATMAIAAINVLDQDPNGFYIMIEGGAVDWANHANQKGRLIEEEMEFIEAVKAVDQWVTQHSSWQQTLLIVTAYHETGYIWGPQAGQFNALVNNGQGKIPGINFNTRGHSNSLVPLFAKGACADKFSQHIIAKDNLYGPYVDNTTVFKVMALNIKK